MPGYGDSMPGRNGYKPEWNKRRIATGNQRLVCFLGCFSQVDYLGEIGGCLGRLSRGDRGSCLGRLSRGDGGSCLGRLSRGWGELFR